MTTSIFFFLVYIAVLVGGGYAITRRWDDAPKTALMLSSDSMNGLTERYNDAINGLEIEYLNRNSMGEWASKREYSDRYNKIASQYSQERKKRFRQWKTSHPLWTKARGLWGWIFFLGFIGMGVTMFSMAPEAPQQQLVSSRSVSNSEETVYWNAQSIPIPYLQDSTQYVSNPDGVLSQNIVDSMNVILKSIENDYDIQTVVAVVGHIENDDPFRMAQDLGNSYGVGRKDRGLVIVVGYEDHSINMSPGRALEAELTDAECHRLEQQYVVPAMRAEMPDSAMLYLTKAVYALMQNKELPQMSSLLYGEDDDGLGLDLSSILLMFFVPAWFIFFSRLNRKYLWTGLLGSVKLNPNPFYEEQKSSGGGFFGGGGGGFGGGGGGFGGGSFGGGSFGGGGATSRW